MNDEKLRYIVEVAKSGSIKRASKNLYVSESAISQSISSIEKELGVKIFNRSRGQDTLLTDEGKRIVQKAYEILIKFEELKELTNFQNKMIKGKLILSTTPGYMSYLINPLYEFKKHYQNVKVKIIENTNLEIIEGIQQQRFDIGLIACFGDVLKNKEDIDFNLLCGGRVKVYARKDLLLGNNGKVLLEDLQEHSLIAYQGKGSYTSLFINKYSEHIGPLNVLFESNCTETILEAVLLGLGYTISYDFLMNSREDIKSGQIIALDIIDNNKSIPLNISFGWAHSKNKHLTSISKKFITNIESIIKK